MLSRPGSKPGPVWMRQISDSFSDPDRSLKLMMPFWAFFVIYMIVCIGLTHFVTAVVLSKDYVYESSTRVAGLPLVSYSPAAHGIIAIGGRATGVIALGGLAFGFIAIGGITVGVISLGGLSMGLFALAGVSLGWRAFGGLAVGHSALGGCAIAKYAYAGNGVAYGTVEASGRQKERLIG
jgi:hypothetical protein